MSSGTRRYGEVIGFRLDIASAGVARPVLRIGAVPATAEPATCRPGAVPATCRPGAVPAVACAPTDAAYPGGDGGASDPGAQNDPPA